MSWRDDLPPLERKAYRALANARYRCTNPGHPQWADYGGRGIRVFQGWRGRHGFERFLATVGAPPTAAHTIERIDNDGNYEPGNVRWATRAEQNRNKRTTRLVTLAGRTLPLVDWAAVTGLSLQTIWRRVARGWSAEDAILLWAPYPVPTAARRDRLRSKTVAETVAALARSHSKSGKRKRRQPQ